MMREGHIESRAVCCSVLLLLLMLTRLVSAEVVERRGAQPPLEGNVFLIDDNAVTVRSASGATQVVPWDRVRDVQLDRHDPTLESRLETAERLWRGRSRLERGDSTLAEPLFERLFETYRGSTHETALVVAEGLLRCRLSRMANETAVVPALEVMRLRRAGVETTSYVSLDSILDPETGLCMLLPPVWIDDRALRAMERELAVYDAHDDNVLAIAAMYRRAARQQLGLEPIALGEQIDDDAVQHEAVKLLELILSVDDVDRPTAIVARSRLTGRLQTMESWSQGWARYALGSSLVNERKLDAQLSGLVHLLHLPASSRFRDQSYLAGLALSTAADALEKLDDAQGAHVLRAEILSRYPGHPVNRINTQYAQRAQ